MARRESRLARETSPYLLAHARNPVDWYPWGQEALSRAQRENKPIFLSIGYSACHWCHVMEGESFEDEEIAALLNREFISIKVDREERPDLDEIYMSATIAISGSGGWPMSVFLTPDQEPFFAGTYFPPRDTDNRPGFVTLLKRLAEMWKSDRGTLLSQSKELTEHMRARQALSPPGGISEDSIRAATRALEAEFDEVYGGFSEAPKFPPPAALALLLRAHQRKENGRFLQMVTRTLDGMMTGGIYDQLGGGFCRYSVDSMWLVPHFEKMLTDNAQLTDVYIEAFQATGHAPYRRVARETLDYALREMQSPSGGFFTASDADSEGEEGKYFVFSAGEVRKILGEPRATHFCAFYGVTEQGNFAGKNVLSARRSLKDVARELGASEEEVLTSLEEGRAELLKARQRRVAPLVDDKILTAQNGLMIRALANAARALGDERYARAAMRAADTLLGPSASGQGVLRPDGGLFRTLRGGRAHTPAFLEDYVLLADGLLALYEAGCGGRYLQQAKILVDRALADFSGAADEALHFTASQGEPLVARPRGGTDSALPNANAVLCILLAKLAVHLSEPSFKERALTIARSFSTPIRRAPRAFCGMLTAIDFLLQDPVEIVVSGSPENAQAAALRRAIATRFLPHRVEAHLFGEKEDRPSSPLLKGRGDEELPTAYVCKNSECLRPVHSPEDLSALVESLEAENRRNRNQELGAILRPGRATPAGTRGYWERQAASPHGATQLGDLQVSRVGLGTHRIGLDAPEHAQAVRASLLGGLNLIDTSPSFAWGDSERVVGQVLGELIDESLVSREEIVIVTKVGVAIGASAERLEERRQAGDEPLFCRALGASGRDGQSEGLSLAAGAFCLEPAFLREQVESSREKLGLLHLDCCLIQSPEHLLESNLDAKSFSDAVGGAFELLESLVREGVIGAYGIMTNTAARPDGDPLRVPVQALHEVARQVAGEKHHFRLLEMPLNLLELTSEAAVRTEKTLATAQALGLSVWATRPLSPFIEGALLRLVDPPQATVEDPVALLRSTRYRVASLEAEFETTFSPALRVTNKVGAGPVLSLSGPLGKTLEQTETREQFRLAESTLVTPRLRQLLARLDEAFAGDSRWHKFRESYVRAVGQYLGSVDELVTAKNRQRLADLHQTLQASDKFGTGLQKGPAEEPWASRGLRLLLQTPHVAGAFIGLRTEAHVQAALKVLRETDA